MAITKINPYFTGEYNNGRKQFEKLSANKKAIKLATEEFRQNFNNKNIGFKLSTPDSDLDDYVRHKILIKKSLKNALKSFKNKTSRS